VALDQAQAQPVQVVQQAHSLYQREVEVVEVVDLLQLQEDLQED
jgi:hypothetical protein